MFSRVCRFTWRQYFIHDSKDRDVTDEISWSIGRPSVSTVGNFDAITAILSDPDGPPPTASELALNVSEAANYKKYFTRWPGGLYMVMQNPDEHKQMSVGDFMPTIIRNTHIIMSREHGR